MVISLKQAFSLVDGRMTTNMSDIKKALEYVFNSKIYDASLMDKLDELKNINPDWLNNAENMIDLIKETHTTNDFKKLMKIIDKDYSNVKIKLSRIK